jgi:hypothetical protein
MPLLCDAAGPLLPKECLLILCCRRVLFPLGSRVRRLAGPSPRVFMRSPGLLFLRLASSAVGVGAGWDWIRAAALARSRSRRFRALPV